MKLPLLGSYGPLVVSWYSCWYMEMLASVRVTVKLEEIASPHTVAGAFSVISKVTGKVIPWTGATGEAGPSTGAGLVVALIAGMAVVVGVVVALGGSCVAVEVAEGAGVVAVGVALPITELKNEQPRLADIRNAATRIKAPAGFILEEFSSINRMPGVSEYIR